VCPIGVPDDGVPHLRDALQALHRAHRTGRLTTASTFGWEDDRPAVLEINPRPSGDAGLVRRGWPDGLSWNTDAVRGRLPGARAEPSKAGWRPWDVLYAAPGCDCVQIELPAWLQRYHAPRHQATLRRCGRSVVHEGPALMRGGRRQLSRPPAPDRAQANRTTAIGGDRE